MMSYNKYLVLISNGSQMIWTFVLNLKKNFKISLFSMRTMAKYRKKWAAPAKVNALRLVLFCFLKKQYQTQGIGFLNPSSCGSEPGPGRGRPFPPPLGLGVGSSAFTGFFTFTFLPPFLHIGNIVGKALKVWCFSEDRVLKSRAPSPRSLVGGRGGFINPMPCVWYSL